MTSTPSTTERARETAGTAQQEGAALASHAKDAGSDVARTASEQASQVASETKAQAADLLRTTRDEVNGQVDAQRQRLVSALRTTGDELHQGREDHSQLTAELSQRAGQYARQVADYLDNRGPDAILDDVRSFARRRPGTFLLLAGAAGVVAGRVFRSVQAAASDSSSSTSSRASFVDSTGTGSTYSGLGVGTTEAIPPVATGYEDDTAIGVAEVPVTPVPGAYGTPSPAYTPATEPFPATGALPGEPGYVDPAYSPVDPAYSSDPYASDPGYPPAPPAAPVTDPADEPVDPYADPRYRDPRGGQQ